MNKVLYLLFIFLIIGCGSQAKEKKIAEPEKKMVEPEKESPKEIKTKKEFNVSLSDFIIPSDSTKTYEVIKNEISDQRLNIVLDDITTDSLSLIFKQSLVNKIFPFWEGTSWSFEGHSSVPRQGEIACGYFVSTTLRDIGLNINRYKLAQQSPINEAKSLSIDMKVIEVAEESKEESIVKINEILKEGIHFIGFSVTHVGFILKEQEQLFLIHSNYIGQEGVIIERIEESDVFSGFSNFYFTELSTNKQLLENWVNGVEIEVVK